MVLMWALPTSNDVHEETINQFLNTVHTNKVLTEESKKNCDGGVTIDECWEALKEMKPYKSPGSDGITTEFFKTFWDNIGPKLVETLNYCKSEENLSVSQRRGVITLLEKKGKDNSKIKNWRPVLLLNIDYTIFTTTFRKANRKTIYLALYILTSQDY